MGRFHFPLLLFQRWRNRSIKLANKVLKESRTPPGLALPAGIWMVWFLLIPMTIVLTYSFFKKGVYGGIIFQFTGENFSRAFDWLYLDIFWQSLKLAGLTAISCLLIGYPLAYVI